MGWAWGPARHETTRERLNLLLSSIIKIKLFITSQGNRTSCCGWVRGLKKLASYSQEV